MLSFRINPYWLFIAAFAALSGCATNALRVDSARSVASQGRIATQASRGFLAHVDLVRREANIELVVADPACHTQPALVRKTPLLRSAQEAGWLCVVPGRTQDTSEKFSVLPLGPQLNSTLDLVESLSSYAEALSEIVDEAPSDPMKPLIDALETARSVQRLIQATAGSGTGPVPAVDDPRLVAVTGFVAFLDELSAEASRVDRLRKRVLLREGATKPMIDVLRADLNGWNRSRAGDQLLRKTVTDAIVERTVDRRPPASFEERRTALYNQYTLLDHHEASLELYKALNTVLDELQNSDEQFRSLLKPNPTLDDKQRRKRAEITRQRLVRALDAVTALATSFLGA